MIASVLILVTSIALFVYWFRYTCLLILSAKTAEDFGRQVAQVNQLSFKDVQERLQADSPELDRLYGLLNRDLQAVTRLVNRAGQASIGGMNIEDRILVFDYQIVKLSYLVVGKFSNSAARKAVSEMADVVGHLANSYGERTAVAHVSC
jgi:hypothetical protein